MHSLFDPFSARSSWRGLGSALIDTAIAHRPCVPLYIHDLGVHLSSDTFRYRNLPTVSDGRDSLSHCWRGAIRLDASEGVPRVQRGLIGRPRQLLGDSCCSEETVE